MNGTAHSRPSNLFGSNPTNMVVLVVLDIAYMKEPLLDNASAAVAGIAGVLLMMVGLTAIAPRAKRRRSPIKTTELVMLGGFAVSMLLVWSVGASS